MFGFARHFQTRLNENRFNETRSIETHARRALLRRCLFSISMFAVAASTVSVSATTGLAQDENAAYSQAGIATNAQNAEDYPMAIDAWKKLLKDHPNSIQAKKIAHVNLGACLMETKDYPAAIESFNKAIPQLTADQSTRLPEAQLSLGFCLLRNGQALAKLDNEKSKEESSIELTTATQSFQRVLVNHSDYEDADQAAYFQGEAYRDLGRLEEAAESYEKMMTFEKQYFKFNGIYSLADVYERLGQYDKAIALYQDFRTLATEAGGHELLDDANFAYAETLMNLGVAQTKRGEDDKAEVSYETADEILDEVNANETYTLRDRAIFKQGLCAEILGEHGRAAGLYEQVAQTDSSLKDRAAVFAGRNFVLDGKEEDGVRWLQKAIDSDSSYSIDAVHLMASQLIKTGQPQAAFELADAWIEKSKDHPKEVDLLMDRADASWAEVKLRDRSAKLYQEIIEQHPNHSLAPQALYAAAFALKSSGEYAESIKLSDQFIETFSDNNYLPDAMGVKAESLLLSKSYPEAEEAYLKLTRDYAGNDSAALWIVNAGNAAYFQDNFQPTIDWIDSNLPAINAAPLQAEAYHLIGSSHFGLKQYTDAITNLTKAINIDGKWSRASETLLNLSQAQAAAGDVTEAQATVNKLASEFPESELASEAHYRLAETAFRTDLAEAAITNYDAIINSFSKSIYMPYALSGAGWTALKAGDNDLASKRFTELLEKFPVDQQDDGQIVKLVQNAKTGRGVAMRNTGDVGQSIADLKSSMESATPGKQKTNAQYELGLAYVKNENWDDAISTFNELIETDADSALADKFYYELAWAHHAKEDAEQELTSFGTLAEKFPDSEFAPEANFFLGTDAYDKKDYANAIGFFTKCNSDSASDEVREKSAYKIGWAHYHMKEFDKALTSFELQTKSFAEGELYADGLFMVGQSHFGSKNYADALKAYTVAKPIIDESATVSENIKRVMLLNAAQAANATKSFDDAIAMATPLTTMESADKTLKQDAWLEIGIANGGKGEYESAIAAYDLASSNLGKTGAQAQCLRGDVFFKQASDAAKAENADESRKKFDEAIQAFKLVYYGYGGPKASAAVRPWQAYAAYEAAQCNVAQINSADAKDKTGLISEGIKHFEYLLKFYPEDRLAEEAKKQLAKLKQLKQ